MGIQPKPLLELLNPPNPQLTNQPSTPPLAPLLNQHRQPPHSPHRVLRKEHPHLLHPPLPVALLLAQPTSHAQPAEEMMIKKCRYHPTWHLKPPTCYHSHTMCIFLEPINTYLKKPLHRHFVRCKSEDPLSSNI